MTWQLPDVIIIAWVWGRAFLKKQHLCSVNLPWINKAIWKHHSSWCVWLKRLDHTVAFVFSRIKWHIKQYLCSSPQLRMVCTPSPAQCGEHEVHMTSHVQCAGCLLSRGHQWCPLNGRRCGLLCHRPRPATPLCQLPSQKPSGWHHWLLEQLPCPVTVR